MQEIQHHVRHTDEMPPTALPLGQHGAKRRSRRQQRFAAVERVLGSDSPLPHSARAACAAAWGLTG
jgi:hypothetical protein